MGRRFPKTDPRRICSFRGPERRTPSSGYPPFFYASGAIIQFGKLQAALCLTQRAVFPPSARPALTPLTVVCRGLEERPSRSRWAVCARVRSRWAAVGSCAIGRFSIVRTKATRRATRSPRSGRNRANASRWRAFWNRAFSPRTNSPRGWERRAFPLSRRRARNHHQGPAEFPLLLEHGDGVGHVRRHRRRRHIARGSRHPGMQDVHGERQARIAQTHTEGRVRPARVKRL